MKCKACGKEIVFLPTSSGKDMPVDAETVAAADTKFIYGKHVSHFATCPEAGKFRRKK